MAEQALPASIDTPLDFEWEVLQQVEDPFMGQALDAAGWLTQDAYPRLDPGAIGNASREEFEWAHQVWSAEVAVVACRTSVVYSMDCIWHYARVLLQT